MPSDLTISARLVAEGVGPIPDGWRVRGIAGMCAGHEGHWLTDPAGREGWGYVVAVAGNEWRMLRARVEEVVVVLSHPETAFGLLRQLALWCGDDGQAQAYWLHWTSRAGTWELRKKCDGRNWRVCAVFDWVHGVDGDEDMEALAAIVRRIGQDHAIRRALGEEPRPGTLAFLGLMQPHEQWWRFDAREHGGAFIEWDRSGRFIGSSGCGGQAPMYVPLTRCERCHRAKDCCMRCQDSPALYREHLITDPNEARAALYAEVCGG